MPFCATIGAFEAGRVRTRILGHPIIVEAVVSEALCELLRPGCGATYSFTPSPICLVAHCTTPCTWGCLLRFFGVAWRHSAQASVQLRETTTCGPR